jgi:plastocyanin
MRNRSIAALAPLGSSLLAGSLLAGSALACVSDRPSTGPEPPAGGGAVAIRNFAYVPPSLTAVTGTTVTWTNEDDAQHTVTADDGSFESAVIGQGGTFELTAPAPGTYEYHCQIHPFMTGTLTVTGE